MGRINVLDPITSNQIKAGEVIERPFSVVKELFDNSVDSGATQIKVEFSNGGISMIRVTDNGSGMDKEDAQKAFLIHATSKLKTISDLYDLSTQGFRGEALASICAVADVSLVTKRRDDSTGTRVIYEDGELKSVDEVGADNGTTIEVTGLFKNIPARYKFMKKDSTEGMYICSLVEKLAIVNPHVSVKLIKDGKQLLVTPGTGEMLDVIYAIYGKETAKALVPVSYEVENYKLKGYTGKTDFVRGNRQLQTVFVNERNIKNSTITAAIDEAYKNAVMKNRFPICFLNIYCKPGSVDVNVHPQKAEVKFSNESDIFRLVFHGIRQAVFESNQASLSFDGITDLLDKNETKEESKPLSTNKAQIVSNPYNKYVGTQMGFDTSRNNSNKGGEQVANNLLQILSEFKPDAQMIKDDYKEKPSIPELLPLDTKIETKATEIEEPEETVINSDIKELTGAEFVGILFVTYIILQSEDHVFFVDQHAAHERVMYEKYMAQKSPSNANYETEELLVPQIINTSSSDYTFISDNIEKFKESGFDIELLDNREIALRSVPLMPGRKQPSKMFEEILSDLKRETPNNSNIWYSLIQTTACKAAIKAGDVITRQEALSLIDMMVNLKDPYHCAHGRPTFFKISKTDFEKNFKRIV